MYTIICSSKALKEMLSKFITNLYPEFNNDDYFQIISKDSELRVFGGFVEFEWRMDIEARSDWSCDFTLGKIKEIKRVLKRIPEQPLTIIFSDGGIKILNVLV